MARVALVTGGNRGIGFESCRQLGAAGLTVVLTARLAADAQEAAARLRDEGLDVLAEQLDVTDAPGVRDCAGRLSAAGIEVDVLINNAGVYPRQPILDVDEALVMQVFQVNLFGPLRACWAFVPAMVRRGYGRVVNVSSTLGAFSHGIGPGAYGISKAALNALTCELAAEVRGDVKVNAADPGWVATRMGGPAARRSPEQGAATVLWLATLPADGPTGGFFRDGRQISW